MARPSVYLENGIFKMYYCHETRVGRYRIGYAESRDGIKWVRKDNYAGIDVSKGKNEWDSEMIEYPYVVKYKSKFFMFYNGNSYGRDGVGLAVLD